MAALAFPSLDVLRLLLANRVVPLEVSGSPARAGLDPQGRLWIEPSTALPRDTLAVLARLGVQTIGVANLAAETIRAWAELLPVKPAAVPAGPVLFELPDSHLSRIAGACRRLSAEPFSSNLLEGEHVGRAWIHSASPPASLVLRAQEMDSPIEAFAEQSPGIWVQLGWAHPVPEHLVVPSGQVLLVRAPRTVCVYPAPLAIAFEEFALAKYTPRSIVKPAKLAVVAVRFQLQKHSPTPRELAWVFRGEAASRFWEFCHGANERLLRQFEAAQTAMHGTTFVVVRPAPGLRIPPFLPLAADGFYPHPQVADLFIPSRRALRPDLRAREISHNFEVGPDRLTWLEAGPSREVQAFAVPVSAFLPVPALLEYVTPPERRLQAEPPRPDPFVLDRFALAPSHEDRFREVEPQLVERPAPACASREKVLQDDRPGWFARSLEHLLKKVRRSGGTALPTGVDGVPTGSKVPPRTDRDDTPKRLEQKLSSPDALVHGQDRSARRHQLESRLLGEFRTFDPAQRALGWRELAEVYSATGNPADAAICWINAVWESSSPRLEWLEQWLLTECRAARQSVPVPSLDRWLSEPGRFGAGRVIAAYAVWGAHQPAPPPDLIESLPRVMAFLDQYFDDLPARAAWLSRLALTQLCSGDALGLARWRDRILIRLRDKGPGLDLDEPSFLRFHGTASPDRFQTAREWLVRAHKPILDWVGKLGSTGRLQWVGLDAEIDCTASYAQLMLAWGLGCLGERTRSRNWAAKAKKSLSRSAGAGLDPAFHAILSDAFQERIRDVQEGRLPKPGFPPELRERVERLTDVHLGRYSLDKLRRHSRILEPVGLGRDYGGLDLRGFRGHDRLGERLQLLADRTDPVVVSEEARQMLALCALEPSSGVVPRVALTLLDLAPHLDATLIGPILDLVVPAASWLETWLEAGSWSDSVRADRLPRYLTRLLGAAFATAAWFNQWPAVRPIVEFLLQRTGSDATVRAAIGRTAGSLFRSLRKLGYRSEAEALLHLLDPGRGEWPADSPAFPPSQFGLAVGWFAVGDEEAGTRILDDARNRLFVARTGDERDRTELAIAYAEALGFAPPRIALGRLEEIFQLLDRVTTTGSTNRYFTLKPLQLIDAVVRSVVTEDFALGPSVRGWLDDDEFLIRRRIHRDMTAVLNEDGRG